MPISALLSVLAAALLHTGWNLLVKQARDKQLFTWWALVIGAIVYSPLLALSGPVPGRIWPYALASAVVEALYFVVLLHAYSRGDFSLVYPVARGAAPALLAVWTMLFLGERPELLGILGLTVLLLGLIIVGSAPWVSGRSQATVHREAITAALTVALCISVYSAIDGAAVRLLDPAPYLVLVQGLTSLLVTPAVVARYGYARIIAQWRAEWPRIMVVAILIIATYLLVLQAYVIARVSYVGALREVGIVLASLIGWRWLGERFGALRTIGAILVFAGVLVIAVAG